MDEWTVVKPSKPTPKRNGNSGVSQGNWKDMICLLTPTYPSRRPCKNVAVRPNIIFEGFIETIISPERCANFGIGDTFFSMLPSGEKYNYEVLSKSCKNGRCHVIFLQHKSHTDVKGRNASLKPFAPLYVDFSFQLPY